MSKKFVGAIPKEEDSVAARAHPDYELNKAWWLRWIDKMVVPESFGGMKFFVEHESTPYLDEKGIERQKFTGRKKIIWTVRQDLHSPGLDNKAWLTFPHVTVSINDSDFLKDSIAGIFYDSPNEIPGGSWGRNISLHQPSYEFKTEVEQTFGENLNRCKWFWQQTNKNPDLLKTLNFSMEKL